LQLILAFVVAGDKMRSDNIYHSLKIYFAYSGRDKDGSNPVDKAIQYLTGPGPESQIYAYEMKHISNNFQRKTPLVEKLAAPIRRSSLAKWIHFSLSAILGEWFVRKMKIGIETENWRPVAKELIEESDILVFLYSEHSRNERNASNIKWEIETAKRLNRNVILCGLDGAEKGIPPEWVKKVDEKALKLNFSQEELRKKIIKHYLNQYSYSHLNLRDVAAEPDSKVAERMFEQYKMYKDETEKLTETRQTVSNFYLLMNGALLTLIGVILDPGQKPAIISVVLLLSSAVGVIISNSWLNMVNYYKILNTSKQRLINAIEESLPLQLNATEYYEIMTDPLNKVRHESFGEAMIPNMIHAGWGGLFLISALIFLIGTIISLWKHFLVRIFLIVLLTALISEPFLESLLYSKRRT